MKRKCALINADDELFQMLDNPDGGKDKSPLIGNLYRPRREKTCLWRFANNIGADQPAHSCSLISAFVIRFLESIICKLATGEILIF